jgi:hypothetical protein
VWFLCVLCAVPRFKYKDVQIRSCSVVDSAPRASNKLFLYNCGIREFGIFGILCNSISIKLKLVDTFYSYKDTRLRLVPSYSPLLNARYLIYYKV